MIYLRSVCRINHFPSNIYSVNLIRKCYCTRPPYDLDLVVRGVSLKNYIKSIEKEYNDLSKRANHKSDSRWLELGPVIRILEDREKVIQNVVGLEELITGDDKDLSKLAAVEKLELDHVIKQLDSKLLHTLVPNDREDSCNSVVLEVQAGVGGQEAMLFAKELFDMYCNFAEYKGWDLQIAEYSTTDIGGIRNGVALLDGNSVFRYMKHEAGVHRVQRTPSTEKSGRIHTSTASVITLPQPEGIDVNIQQKDLKIETKRSSGAGGQHVNKTESAVRIVHIPTGIAVECQVDRSQIKNRKMAMARLSALLYEKEMNAQSAEIRNVRRSQVQTRNRNEKIRTYNFNQDRITDHRLGENIHNLKCFMEGGAPLKSLIQQLDEHYRIDGLLNIVNNFK